MYYFCYPLFHNTHCFKAAMIRQTQKVEDLYKGLFYRSDMHTNINVLLLLLLLCNYKLV